MLGLCEKRVGGATVLDSVWRRPALVRHVVALAPYVVCLQEVEDETFAAVQQVLGPLGYTGHFAKKGGGKPDRCATFVHQSTLIWRTIHQLMYTDGSGTERDSGHLALVVLCKYKGRTLGLVNTHLQWAPPGIPPDHQCGYRQIRQLLQERCRMTAIDTHLAPSYTGVTASYQSLDTRVEALWQCIVYRGSWFMAAAA